MVAGYCGLCRVKSCGASPFTEGHLISDWAADGATHTQRGVASGLDKLHLYDITMKATVRGLKKRGTLILRIKTFTRLLFFVLKCWKWRTLEQHGATFTEQQRHVVINSFGLRVPVINAKFRLHDFQSGWITGQFTLNDSPPPQKLLEIDHSSSHALCYAWWCCIPLLGFWLYISPFFNLTPSCALIGWSCPRFI